MSFHRIPTSGNAPSSSTLALTSEVTSTASGVLWERQISSPLMDVRAEEGKAEDEEAVWNQYHRLTEVGVAPTTAPCSSPVHFHLPALRPRRKSNHRKSKNSATSMLRDLDPRVRFYVTAANAPDYVTSGKVYMRSVWNRAPLGRRAETATAHGVLGSSEGQAKRTEHSAGGGGGGENSVTLNLDVTKIQTQQQEGETRDALSSFAINVIQDHVPGMNVTLIRQEPPSSAHQESIATTVNQDAHSGRSQGGRSANYGSARRRMGLSSQPSVDNEQGEEMQPVHPFLRMYQTRPGAFARLLSREAEVKVARIAPGSTIASLMVPHPALASERSEGEEWEGEMQECVLQGTTIDMKNKKKRKKPRPRFILPPLGFRAMDWMNRQQRRSGRRKQDVTGGKNSNDNDGEDEGDQTKRGRSRTRVPKAGLHILSEFPKQFVLSSREDDVNNDLNRSLSDSDVDDWRKEESRAPEELRRLGREMDAFTDMDYVLPSHLDELLRQEGVDERVVDTTVAGGKVWHDRAVYLNHVYHIKRRKYLARPSRFSSLPPISKAQSRSAANTQPLPPPSHDVDARREWRENRSRPWELPEIVPEPSETKEVQNKPKQETPESKVRAELDTLRTNIDRLRWEAEKQEEVASLAPDFVQPRLVLISSKVPRCQSMSKAIRRGDNSVLYIVYDFDTCSFTELLDTARAQLEQYSPGCKAKSALFMCQGAEGCLYMFRKIVLTPQKMKRVQYQQIKEFWKSLGELMSKMDHEETGIHLLGGVLNNPQGKSLLYEIQRAVLPNLATVTAVDENTESGREVIEQYFDFRKFILWRAKHDSRNTLDYTDITRSWSSLADEAEDMDTR